MAYGFQSSWSTQRPSRPLQARTRVRLRGTGLRGEPDATRTDDSDPAPTTKPVVRSSRRVTPVAHMLGAMFPSRTGRRVAATATGHRHSIVAAGRGRLFPQPGCESGP